MEMLHVTASRNYDILIGRALLKDAGALLAETGALNTAVVVSDDNVFPLYGEAVMKSLEKAGARVLSFVFPHGEHSKNLKTYAELMEFLCAQRAGRNDLLVALGGGVVGDLTGFAAATYQRGMRYAQIPTTLLAAVDSSIGGKTAVDLIGGKNQAGCFYQPVRVICDEDTLKTLPAEEMRCGMAEVIKYGVIGDRALFDCVKRDGLSAPMGYVIKTCAAMKRDIVARDEFDRGERMQLNLGHTFGHAAEKCSGYSILHGQAVAMGLAAITRAAVKKGYCDEATLTDTLETLKICGLPTEIDYPLDDMAAAALSDKKATGKGVRLIVPEGIGKCAIVEVTADGVKDWMQAGGIGHD